MKPRYFVVQKLREIADPTTESVWDGSRRPISVAEVQKSVSQGILADAVDWRIGKWSRKFHIARVAFLVVHGWSDPIELDVGIPWLLGGSGWWPIQDGNHRFLAAIVRGDKTILGDAAGCVREINRLCRK